MVDDLREATSINWVIVDTEQEATDGVYAGDYYAAVVIDRDFSAKMYRMLTDWSGKPAITYYENAKKKMCIRDSPMPARPSASTSCTRARMCSSSTTI